MKHLYSFMLLGLLSISTISWGQNITTTNTTGPSTCDGTAYFQNWSNYPQPMWTFSWFQDSTQIAGNDSLISGLCAGNYSLVFDSSGTVVNTVAFVITNPCAGLTVSLVPTNTTPNACVGSISAAVTGGSAPYTYVWSNGITTQNATNLCVGVYSIQVTDANGCIANASAPIYDGSGSNIQANLQMADDTTGNCWGGGNCFPSGGNAPYTITWSNGQTGNYSGQLCAGIYSVTIIDQTGDSLTESFIITNPGTTYNNPNYPNSTYTDTLYGSLVNNCIIDYTNIDSVSLSQAVYDSVSQNLYVTWSIYDINGNLTTIFDTLGLTGQTGTYSVNISVYCPFKTSPKYFKIWSDFYLNGSDVSLVVESMQLEDVSVYPNPFESGFVIQNEAGKLTSYSLYNVQGKLIQQNNQLETGIIQVDGLNNLSAGTYLLHVKGQNGAQRTFKLIK